VRHEPKSTDGCLRILVLSVVAATLAACGEFDIKVDAYSGGTHVARFDIQGTADIVPLLLTLQPTQASTAGPTPEPTPRPLPSVTPEPIPSFTPQPPPIPTLPSPNEGIVLEGFVYRTADPSQGVVGGVEIYLEYAEDADPGPQYLIAVTDRSGYYISQPVDMRPGEVLTAYAGGPDKVFWPLGHSWEYGGGSERHRFDFVATQLVSLTGNVVRRSDTSGMPGVGICVDADSGQGCGYAPITHADGRYEAIVALPIGADVNVAAYARGFRFEPTGVGWTNLVGVHDHYADFLGEPGCVDAPRSRVSVGSKARVTFTDGTPLRMRQEPSVSGNIIAALSEGSTLTILEDPTCADGFAWWRVDTDGGKRGWVAEADWRNYFIEPVG